MEKTKIKKRGRDWPIFKKTGKSGHTARDLGRYVPCGALDVNVSKKLTFKKIFPKTASHRILRQSLSPPRSEFRKGLSNKMKKMIFFKFVF